MDSVVGRRFSAGRAKGSIGAPRFRRQAEADAWGSFIELLVLGPIVPLELTWQRWR